jgi:hypothetical protein
MATEEGTASNIEAVRKLFNVVMLDIKQADIDDLYNLCMKVVCRARYYNTDAELILQGINNAKRDNPDINIREAACVSAINYVAAWVARMLKVVPI